MESHGLDSTEETPCEVIQSNAPESNINSLHDSIDRSYLPSDYSVVESTVPDEEDDKNYTTTAVSSKCERDSTDPQDCQTSVPSNNGLELFQSTAVVSQFDTLSIHQPPEATPSAGMPSTKDLRALRRLPNSVSKQRYSTSSSVFGNKRGDFDITPDQVNVEDLRAALQQLSRDARFRSIRPPWRDPNSQALPSDDTACVEEMLREYNLLTSASKKYGKAGLATPQLVVRRPYHTTLNRWRQQERIQMENFYMANRLKNVQPSPEISREELLKRHKEYFITPLTARSLTSLASTDHMDFEFGSHRSRNSSCCSTLSRPFSANPVKLLRPVTARRREFTQEASARSSRPLTSSSVSRTKSRKPKSASSVKPPTKGGDRPPPTCNCTSKHPNHSPQASELIDSLNSVRKALYIERANGKL
ncbi:unnamed protein product [Mesocestoides corti]|uniref:Uncharacterized protein n=1 Tax=Mesocestoides corti TaxID=53468 RepID=A0A3P6HAW3_MESCO|nr:unnamed protein product [Mesocestoides corti]